MVLCQVEKAKEDMLNQLYTSIRLVQLKKHLGISHPICYLCEEKKLIVALCMIFLLFASLFL